MGLITMFGIISQTQMCPTISLPGSLVDQLSGKNVPRQHLIEEAQVLAAKILMGAAVPTEMEEDDVSYLDNTLHIMKGHRGTVQVPPYVPTFPAAMG
eukprot:7509171-Ditylum_brightwellii.AAC.1